MASNDLRDLKFAAGYDAVLLAISVSSWYWLIRPARQDVFRPNPRDRLASRLSKGPSEFEDESVWSNQRCSHICSRDHWLVRLWRWDIKKFTSTDVYLYLLFQRTCLILFFAVAALTLPIGLPIIWTASSAYKTDARGVRIQKTFFDRAVITNIPVTEVKRLWAIYALVWAVFVVGMFAAALHHRAVNHEDFRGFSAMFRQAWRATARGARAAASAVTCGRVRSEKPRDACYKNTLGQRRQRFMPNKRTVLVSGIDKNLRDKSKLEEALLQFFQPDEVAAVHLIMNYQQAFDAQANYTSAVNKIQKIENKIFKIYSEALKPVSSRRAKLAKVFNPKQWCGGARNPPATVVDSRPLLCFSAHSSEPNEASLIDSDSQSSGSEVESEDDTLYEECDSEPATPDDDDIFVGGIAFHPGLRMGSQCRGNEGPVVRIQIAPEHNASVDSNTEFKRADTQPTIAQESSLPREDELPVALWTAKSAELTPDHLHPSQALPRPEALHVQPGQLPFSTMDSAVLSPRNTRSHRPSRLNPPPIEALSEKARKDLKVLQKELARLEAIAKEKLVHLESLLTKKPTHNVGKAFVSFTTIEAARFCLTHDLAHPACPVFRAERRPKHEEVNDLLQLQGDIEAAESDATPGTTRRNCSIATTYGVISPETVDDQVILAKEATLKSTSRRYRRESMKNPPAVICVKCQHDITQEHCRCGRAWHPNWRCREAPPPEDIIWSNMHVGLISRAYRILTINIGIFLLLFMLTSSTAGATVLLSVSHNLEEILAKASFFKISVSGWFMPMLLYLINALLLPFLVSQGAGFSKFWRTSSRDRTVLYANVHYMVINSLVFPVLGTTSFQTLILFFTNTSINEIPAILGSMVAGASGSFVLRYLLNTTLINTSMQLMQLPMFSQQRVLIKLGKRANRWNFDYGFWYAFHLAVFSVCIVFAVDFPLVPLMGGLFFTCKYWVDKYNLSMRVWRTKCESDGVVASSAASFMFYFLSLFLFLMSGYFFAIAFAVRGQLAGQDDLEGYHGSNFISALYSGNKASRHFSIGALALLLMALLVVVIAAGEKAQRSVMLTQSSSIRRFIHRVHVRLARTLEHWRITAPLRGVVSVTVPDHLSAAKLELLQNAYMHPFECRDRINQFISSQKSKS